MTDPCHDTACSEGRLSRRGLIGGAASLAFWGLAPRIPALAGTRDPRFLVMVLRGGLDGLSLAAPVGDPDYARLRGSLALPASGQGAGLPLDGFFALNGNMPVLHGLFRKGEALIVHAVATPYRGRSHFDGQDVLESGVANGGRIDDGWLNRALAGMPAAGRPEPHNGLAMGAVVPLVMRGGAPVLSWIPKVYGIALADSTVGRLMDLYAGSDPVLAKALALGIEIERVGGGQVPPAAKAAPAPAKASPPPQQQRQFREFIDAAEAAARFFTTAGGPRIGALSYNGWDTHANEGVATGQLANRLLGLDAAIQALADGLGPAWKETVVAIVTEFGRTARVNGTEGSDHGTGMAAILVGGAVKGGRVIADWPGLAEASLHEGRDLKPTRDLRTVLKGVMRDHLAIPAGALGERVFPGSGGVAPLDGLIA